MAKAPPSPPPFSFLPCLEGRAKGVLERKEPAGLVKDPAAWESIYSYQLGGGGGCCATDRTPDTGKDEQSN